MMRRANIWEEPGFYTRGCDMQGFSFFDSDTVTVYNRLLDEDTDVETWIPHVLEHVELVVTKGANVSKSGMENADSAKLNIAPVQLENYVSPKVWKRMEAEERERHFTFTGGEDFFVEGDVSGEPVLPEGFYGYMKSRYDNVFKVTDVDNYKDVLPHLEVGGR